MERKYITTMYTKIRNKINFTKRDVLHFLFIMALALLPIFFSSSLKKLSLKTCAKPTELSFLDQARKKFACSILEKQGPIYASSLLHGINLNFNPLLMDKLRELGLLHILAASGENLNQLIFIFILFFRRKNFLLLILLCFYFIFSGKDPTIGRAYYLFLSAQIFSLNITQRIGLVYATEFFLFRPHRINGSFYLSLIASLLVIFIWKNLKIRGKIISFIYFLTTNFCISIIMASVCGILFGTSFSLKNLLLGSLIAPILGPILGITSILCIIPFQKLLSLLGNFEEKILILLPYHFSSPLYVIDTFEFHQSFFIFLLGLTITQVTSLVMRKPFSPR